MLNTVYPYSFPGLRCTCVTYAYKGQGKGPGGSYVVGGASPTARTNRQPPGHQPPHPTTFQEHHAEGPEPCRGDDRREMRPPPTGRSTAPDLSRHHSQQCPFLQPHPGLLWRDLMIQAEEVEEITGTPPGIAVPVRIVAVEDLEARSQVASIVMLFERTGADAATI